MGQFHLHRSRANLRIGEHGIDGVDGAAGDADTREVGDPLGRGPGARGPAQPVDQLCPMADSLLIGREARIGCEFPQARDGAQARVSSPLPGRSILMTSAPRSARTCPAHGPARIRDRSRTVTCDRALFIGLAHVWRPRPCAAQARGGLRDSRPQLCDARPVVETLRAGTWDA